jgi:hypothetical protein
MVVNFSIVVTKEVSHKCVESTKHHITKQQKNCNKIIIHTSDKSPLKDVQTFNALPHCQMSETGNYKKSCIKENKVAKYLTLYLKPKNHDVTKHQNEASK